MSGAATGSIANPDIREPLLVHLFVTAVLLFLVTRQMVDERPDESATGNYFALIFFRLPLVALGFVSIALAVTTLINFLVPHNYWVIGFIIPGIACIWTFFAYDSIRRTIVYNAALESEPQELNKISVAPPSSAEIAAEKSNPSPLGTFNAHILTGGLQAGYLASLLIIIGIGAYYFAVLRRAFIEQEFNGWGSLTRIFEIVWEASGASIVAIVVTMLALYLFMGIGIAAWQAIRKSANENYDRNLSDQEVATINNASTKMQAYLDDKKPAKLAAVSYWVFILGFFIIMLGITFFAIGDKGWGSSYFEYQRTAGLSWYIYKDEIGFSEILAIFTLIFVYFSAGMGLGVIWREFGEYGYLASKQQSGDVSAQLSKAIAEDVRRGRIIDVPTFDPNHYLWRANRTMAGWMGVISALMLIINAMFWYLDRMDYAIISENGVVYTDYWTSTTYRASYSDIFRIESSCRINDDDDLILRYDFVLAEERTINVVSFDTPKQFRNALVQLLDAWTKADRLARKNGVIPTHGMTEPRIGKSKPKFSEQDCRSGLQEYLDAETVEEVIQLLS